MTAFMFSIILAILATLSPSGDADFDGYTNLREHVNYCSALDPDSLPMCADGDDDGLGETPPPAPQCDRYAYGMVPCI